MMGECVDREMQGTKTGALRKKRVEVEVGCGEEEKEKKTIHGLNHLLSLAASQKNSHFLPLTYPRSLPEEPPEPEIARDLSDVLF